MLRKVYNRGFRGPIFDTLEDYLTDRWQTDYDILLQWPFSRLLHIGLRDQLDPLNTWTKTIRPDQDPAYKKPTIATKTGASAIVVKNVFPHFKLFSETEKILIDCASFLEIRFSDPPVTKTHIQTSFLFPFP